VAAGTAVAQAVPTKPSPAVDGAVIGVTVINRSRGDVPSGPVSAEPGDVLEYRLVFRNRERTAIRRVVLANPIPTGVTYVSGSARMTRGSATAEYALSLSGPFSAAPTVPVSQPDGSTVTVPAPPERYAAVRWVVSSPVAGLDSVTALFQVRVANRRIR